MSNQKPTTQYRKVPAVLVVNGNLDAETAFSQASYTARMIAMQGGAKNVRLAEVDGATHGTIFFSPVAGSNVPCTLEMLARMVTSSNPLAPNTTECLGRLAPVDWAGDTAAVKAASAEMFGTSDLWGKRAAEAVTLHSLTHTRTHIRQVVAIDDM